MVKAMQAFSLSRNVDIQTTQLSITAANINSSHSKVLAALSEGDFVRAKNALHTLQFAFEEYLAEQHTALNKKISETKELISKFKQLAVGRIPRTITELELMFSSISEEELPEIENTLPISKKEFHELAKRAKELSSNQLNLEMDEFLQRADFDANGNSTALLAGKLSRKLAVLLGDANSIYTELQNAAEKIKAKAVVAFNSAVVKYKNSNPSEDAQYVLAEAKTHIDSGNYVKGMLLANRASSLLTFAQSGEFTLPLSIFPLAAVIAIVLFVRCRNNSKIPKRAHRIMRNH
jgi:TolA-binding protein